MTAVQCMYYAHTNYVFAIHMYMYCIEKSVNISITRVTGVNNIMLLLAVISLYMLTFRLMVTMVAEFCLLVILIHCWER